MEYKFRTRGVCASEITFELEDGIVSNVAFRGGCNGNLKAIAKLVDGKKAEEIAEVEPAEAETVLLDAAETAETVEAIAE